MISRYDQFVERFVQAATSYVLELRPSLPQLGRHEITDDEGLICWSYYLAMLGSEALWSVLHLVRQNGVRIAYGVSRFVFEYLLRLEYYATHKDAARIAFASIAARITFHGNNYGNLDPTVIGEMRSHVDGWRKSEPDSSFRSLLKMSDASKAVLSGLSKRIMTEFYEVPSGFVHGAGTTMMDVLQAQVMADTVYDPNKTLSDTTLHLFGMLDVLRSQFPNIYGSAEYLDAWFTRFADLAGDNLYLKTERETA